ncbi:MAG TPA: S8 family serine peptidase, partial [Hyphomicrobiales bacterium]|nr:S8 family serine peptidase [Hyphomicrobiales bacterium]
IRRAEPIVQDPSLVCAGDRCAGRKAIQWRDALAPCARGLRVGVIDTGYDAAHPVFEGRRIHQRDFHPENRPAAPQWHGTAVLSILAGKPQSSTPGLIPDAEFFVADVFFTEADGGLATDTASLLSALKWMDESDVRIINMSFSGPRDPIVEEAIGEASGKGVVLVAAAGNEGPNASPAYPAAYKQVIAVTAVSKELRNYRYANRGDHIDVAAPGVDIWAAVPQAQAGYLSGTSFAAPFATAVMSILPDDRLGLPKDELLDSLTFIDLGESGRDPVYGRGLLLAPETCSTPRETVASAAH